MIDVSDLAVRLGHRLVLDGVGFDTGGSRMTGVVGPNGSGKTTLLRAVQGAIAPERGGVRVDGRDVRGLRRREAARLVAVVGQHHTDAVELSVLDTVLLGRLPVRGVLRHGGAAERSLAEDALARVGLGGRGEERMTELSGGEAQRARIARAIVQETPHLLLDEPTNHLDIRYGHEILALVRETAESSLVILHDLDLAAEYCDRLVLLAEGRATAVGTPDEVLTAADILRAYGMEAEEATTPSGRRRLLLVPPAREPLAHPTHRPSERTAR